MINTHNVLNAVTAMQQNAQAALPVIPNNGNPAGAYNMPQQTMGEMQQQPQQAAPAEKSPYYYPWLAPSSHMQGIKDNLAQRQEMLNSMLSQYQPQPIAPQAPAPPVAPMQQQPVQAPQMQTGAAPVIPQFSTEIAPPPIRAF